MKSSIHFKIFILSILIIIPIGILYFNLGEDLYINVKENLENNRNYINICNPTKAHFYDLSNSLQIKPKSLSLSDISSCKYECNDLSNCDLYIIKNNFCEMYDLKTGFDKIQVNCNNKPLPTLPDYNYLGEGHVDKKFYNSNKNKFEHIDYLLDKANDVKTDYIAINEELNRLKGSSEKRDDLISMYDNVNSKLKNLADYLDLSRNSLYSNFVLNPTYSMQATDRIKLGNKDLTYIGMLKEFDRFYDESMDLEGRMTNDNLEYDRKYLVYTILTILMIISVIIFVVYKLLPDLIKDSFIISYFVGVLLLVFFIHNYFKV